MDPRKCHDLDPRLLVIGDQGHYAHNGLNIVRAMFSLKAWLGIIFHTIVTIDPRKCHDLDPKSLVKGHYTHNG
jgi:hypothetical protein